MPPTDEQMAAARSITDEFLDELEQVLTLYYDGWRAFGLLAAEYGETAKKIKAALKLSDDEIDKLEHKYYYQLAANLPEAEVAIRSHKQYRQDNEHNGRNSQRLGTLCMVQIYTLWNDKYRPMLKEQLGDAPNSDIMGDIRYLRHSIVHHKGVAIQEVSKCKVVHWFKPGDTIAIFFDQFRLLWQWIRDDMATLRQSIS
jgi:hypothetical protein